MYGVRFDDEFFLPDKLTEDFLNGELAQPAGPWSCDMLLLVITMQIAH